MYPCFPLNSKVFWLAQNILTGPVFWLLQWIFLGEALTPIFGDTDAGILSFVQTLACQVVIFDAEQVYLKLQATNFKIKPASYSDNKT